MRLRWRYSGSARISFLGWFFLCGASKGGGHKSREQWMGMVRFRKEFRMELGTDVKRMVRKFDDLHKSLVC